MQIYSLPAAFRSENGNILVEVLEWNQELDIASIQDHRLFARPKQKTGDGAAGESREVLRYPNGSMEYFLFPTGEYRLLWEIKGEFLTSEIYSLLNALDPCEYYAWNDAQTAFFYRRLQTLRSRNCPVELLKSVSGRLAGNMGSNPAPIQQKIF